MIAVTIKDISTKDKTSESYTDNIKKSFITATWLPRAFMFLYWYFYERKGDLVTFLFANISDDVEISLIDEVTVISG